MKYEAELLAEIIENRGHEKSSIHYESECKEVFIEECRGSYPKLCDYESEWLNYMVENPIGEFPYETITGVTETTINNVVPLAFKSAILKGQTLVNYFNPNTISKLTDEGFLLNQPDFSKQNVFSYIPLQPYEDNTEYTIIVWLKDVVNPNNVALCCSFGGSDLFIGKFKNGINIIKGTTKTISGNSNIRLSNTDVKNGAGATLIGAVVLKGDYTTISLNSPFYGMQSVKMPVLTTSNGDGTKTNILTTNEEVELRKLGNVQDELDLLTGELTQRVGEIVLDGSENWSRAKNSDGTYRFGTVIDNMYNNKLPITPKNIFIKADKLPIVEFTVDTFPTTNSISAYGNVIVFYIDEIQEISDFKAWLSQNPTTVQYQLATESIKTVDLNVVDQDGNTLSKIKPIEGTMNMETDGQPLKPLLSAEVPVEAIKQNLASFINEE